jgi:glycosyltransferase involved in cell wall biosynthesis
MPHSNTNATIARSPLVAPENHYPYLSVVVPIYNEVDSLPLLLQAIADALIQAGFVPGAEAIAEHSDQVNSDQCFEIICVDDGSSDGSVALLKQLAIENPSYNLKAIILRRNYGQTAAMSAGFNHASGQVIVSMDGDLQNDPSDIPYLLDKLAEGYDMVSGWRKNRQDRALTRVLPSKIANWLIGKTTGVQIHDYGCSLKAYRAELIADLNLYGELHRFLPALAYIEGARIAEIPVKHHSRQYGKSKYGLWRTFRVLMDLLTIYFFKTFLTRPMHVFGLLGLGSMSIGMVLGLHLVYVKLFLAQDIGDRPLLILAIVLVLAGIQLFCFGLLAELMMRTYHESQNRPIYRVREIITAQPEPGQSQRSN